MALRYQTTHALREAYRSRTARIFDNYTIVTGEVGTWKSLWMRKFCRYLDPKLCVSRIHFTQDDYLQDAVTLRNGDGIIMDEFRASRRLAMHGFRHELLDFNKEGRQLGLNAFFGYPDADDVDDALMRRFEWWHHKPNRETVEVRQRTGGLAFDEKGKPVKIVKWPLVGLFHVTGANDPLRFEYEAKKEARMRDRAARYRETHGGKEPEAPKSTRLPGGFLDLALADIKRAP